MSPVNRRTTAEGPAKRSGGVESRSASSGRVADVPAPASFQPWPPLAVEPCLVSRFQSQVELHSDKTAIATRDGHWTYDELNRAADQAASLIRASSSAVDNRIGILVQRDLSTFAMMVGALKAGRPFVPLDPDFPLSRNQFVLDDTGAEFVLSGGENETTAQFSQRSSTPVIHLGDATHSPPAMPESAHEVLPDSLAYIVYTSGSTGKPKGVMQTRRNLLHHVRNYSYGLRINASDRLTLFFSCAFAAAFMDVFSALLSGATLYPFNLAAVSPEETESWLATNRISVFHSLPSVFRRFAQNLDSHATLPDLRIFDVAGEPLIQADVELFKERFSPPCVMVNHLALTEASVAAQFVIDHQTEALSSPMPVGFAAEGIELVVCDESHGPVADSHEGELVVRSKYVSPGYWNNTELTNATFAKSAGHHDNVVYRTGDLGSRTQDGCITHLGRKDDRVKIRGYSVEAAEVENALLRLDHVEGAVVIARPNIREHQSLVAYIDTDDTSAIAVDKLRRSLHQHLPGHMIPSRFVIVDGFPTLSSGKVDRSRLPEPDDRRPQLVDLPLAPTRNIESALIDIWERTLNLTGIGVADSFFDLGGDSLLALELCIAIESRIGRKVSPSSLIAAPTIRQQAIYLKSTEEGRVQDVSLVNIRSDGDQPPIFCVHGGGGTVLFYQFLASHLLGRHPVYAFQLIDRDIRQPGGFTVESLAARYVDELLRERPQGPYVLMGFSFGGLVAFEMTKVLQTKGVQVILLALLDAPAPSAQIRWKRLLAVVSAVVSDRSNFAGARQFVLRSRMALEGALHRIRDFDREKSAQPTAIADLPQFGSRQSFRAFMKYKPGHISANTLLVVAERAVPDQWQSLIREKLHVRHIDCLHDELLAEPYIQVMAASINEALRATLHRNGNVSAGTV